MSTQRMEANGTKKRIKGWEERKGKEKTMQEMKGKQNANKVLQGYVPNQPHLQMQNVENRHHAWKERRGKDRRHMK